MRSFQRTSCLVLSMAAAVALAQNASTQIEPKEPDFGILLKLTPNISDVPDTRFTVIVDGSEMIFMSLDSVGLSLDADLDAIMIASSDEQLAVPLNKTLKLSDDPDRFSGLKNVSIPIRGVFLGKPIITISFTDRNGSTIPVRVNNGIDDAGYDDLEWMTEVQYPVAVVRSSSDQKLSNIFTVFLGVLTFVNTFIMGLQLDWKVIKSVVKKPIAPVLGFICQYGMMPLIASGWAFLILAGQPNLQFGYFSVGCSPGGGPSNMVTLLLGGNLDLSVTMTFFSNIAALAMMPAWLFSMGTVFYGGKLVIPFVNIILSLALMIGPVFLGIVTKHFRPEWGKKTEKLVKFSSLFIMVFALPFGIYANFFIFQQITGVSILCGLLLPYTGFAVAYIVGAMFRQGRKNNMTIAVETGIQNASISVVLINFSLPKPESDMSLVMPISVLILTPLPLIALIIIKNVYERVTSSKGKESEEPKEKAEQEKNDKSFVPSHQKSPEVCPTSPDQEKSPEFDRTVVSAYNMKPLSPVENLSKIQPKEAYENKAAVFNDEDKRGETRL